MDAYQAQQLTAAGLTLLRRSASLVRVLSGRRSAILLPASPAFYVALAASEGRAAVLIDPRTSRSGIAYQLATESVAAVFTSSVLATKLPAHLARVVMDDAPHTAHVAIDGIGRDIDLGSHVGLPVEGDHDVAGSDEPVAIVYGRAKGVHGLPSVLSHKTLLSTARAAARVFAITDTDRVLALVPVADVFGLAVAAVAPLLEGGSVITSHHADLSALAQTIVGGGVTHVVGVPAAYWALLSGTAPLHGHDLRGVLRVCVCGPSAPSDRLRLRWYDATGVALSGGAVQADGSLSFVEDMAEG